MQKRFGISLIFLLLFALAFLPGCGAEGQTSTVMEERGEEQRIVSLIPSNTEILFALGAGPQVVGVSDWDNYPEGVQNLAKIGGIELNVEGVIALAPDLVFAHQSSLNTWADGLEQLRQAGIEVLIVNEATSFAEVYRSIEMIAEAIGRAEAGAELIASMQGELEQIAQLAATIPVEERPTVWIEVSEDLYTAGHGTFMDEMLQLLQASNLAGNEEGWFQLSEEAVIAGQPDVIFNTYGYYLPDATEQIMARPGWEEIPAIRGGRVYELDSDLVTRPGPRLVEGVKEMASALYPHLFHE